MKRMLPVLLAAGVAVLLGVSAPDAAARKRCEVELEVAKIYWEYNSSGNDLGVHVFLDGEDWVTMKITNPDGRTIFKVEGKGPYKELGMTELFFEGAEPSLDDFPLEDLLDLFPPGEYEFEGRTAEGCEIEGVALFSHAVPEGPGISASLNGNSLVISWDDVVSTPEGFPDEDLDIVGYQVIVGSFQVTLPASLNQVTVPPEYVGSLEAGTHDFEVLAIDASGNQSITEGSFTKP
jgi:hypothetical protein